jgi:hypothetical protein
MAIRGDIAEEDSIMMFEKTVEGIFLPIVERNNILLLHERQ